MLSYSFHTFKTAGDIFYLKEDITYESSNSIYVVICSTCNTEYFGETRKSETRVHDRV